MEVLITKVMRNKYYAGTYISLHSYHVKHRKHFKRKSGGIIIIYEDTISKYLTFPTSNSEFVQWVEIANEISNFTKLLIGCVYILPENTKYTSDNAFNEI